jgi:hypothetical protein
MMAACVAAMTAVLLAVGGQDVVPTAEQQVAGTVKAGMHVSVVDVAGASREGRVESVSAGGIRLASRGGPYEIPADRIVRVEKSDSLRNGALAGLIVGLGLSVAAVIDTGGWSGDNAFVASAIITNGLVGAAIGTGLDALVNTKRTLYMRGRPGTQARIAPYVGASGGGVTVQVGW